MTGPLTFKNEDLSRKTIKKGQRNRAQQSETTEKGESPSFLLVSRGHHCLKV